MNKNKSETKATRNWSPRMESDKKVYVDQFNKGEKRLYTIEKQIENHKRVVHTTHTIASGIKRPHNRRYERRSVHQR